MFDKDKLLEAYDKTSYVYEDKNLTAEESEKLEEILFLFSEILDETEKQGGEV